MYAFIGYQESRCIRQRWPSLVTWAARLAGPGLEGKHVSLAWEPRSLSSDITGTVTVMMRAITLRCAGKRGSCGTLHVCASRKHHSIGSEGSHHESIKIAWTRAESTGPDTSPVWGRPAEVT